MSIQTYNIEDPVFDSDELATRLGRGCSSEEGNVLIEWLQFYDPVQKAGLDIDDEDVGAALLSDLTPTGVDIDGDKIPILVLSQPHTLGQPDLWAEADLAEGQEILVVHLDPLAIDDNNFLSTLTNQKIPGRDLRRKLGEYLPLVAVSDQLLAEETNE